MLLSLRTLCGHIINRRIQMTKTCSPFVPLVCLYSVKMAHGSRVRTKWEDGGSVCWPQPIPNVWRSPLSISRLILGGHTHEQGEPRRKQGRDLPEQQMPFLYYLATYARSLLQAHQRMPYKQLMLSWFSHTCLTCNKCILA